jgi:hypothetical protein
MKERRAYISYCIFSRRALAVGDCCGQGQVRGSSIRCGVMVLTALPPVALSFAVINLVLDWIVASWPVLGVT